MGLLSDGYVTSLCPVPTTMNNMYSQKGHKVRAKRARVSSIYINEQGVPGHGVYQFLGGCVPAPRGGPGRLVGIIGGSFLGPFFGHRLLHFPDNLLGSFFWLFLPWGATR